MFVFAWLRGSGSGLRFRIHDSWLAFLFVWHYRAIVQQTSGKLQPWSIWIYTEDKNKLKRGHHSLDKPRTKRLFADDFNMLKFNCLFSCKLQTWFFSQKSWYQSTNTWLAKAPTGTSIGQLTLEGMQPFWWLFRNAMESFNISMVSNLAIPSNRTTCEESVSACLPST